MGRFLVCLVVSLCCVALLAPVYGVRVPGLVGGSVGKQRADSVSFPRAAEVKQQQQVTRSSSPSWSRSPPAAAAGGRGAAEELRSVPAGPDPLHHHGGSPVRPEQEHRIP